MNKIAIITGASSGIGASFAKILASRGYNLIITGRRKDKIQKLADDLKKEYTFRKTIEHPKGSEFKNLEKMENWREKKKK